MTDEPARKPKFSKDLLDLRHTEVTLAKQGMYADAHKVKVRADAMEAAEIERMQAEREQQISHAEVKYLHKQEQELRALRQRIQVGAEEQRKARQMDLERLLQRYHNTKAALELQQTAERVRDRRGLSSTSISTSAASSRLGSARARPSSSSRKARPPSAKKRPDAQSG